MNGEHPDKLALPTKDDLFCPHGIRGRENCIACEDLTTLGRTAKATIIACQRCRTMNAGPGRCGGCGRWLGPRPLHDYSKKELARRG